MKRGKKQVGKSSGKEKSRQQERDDESHRLREQEHYGDPGPHYGEPPAKVRFEATIHAGPNLKSADLINWLDIDQIPDAKGELRALVTADECVRLLENGFEVRLHRAHPVRPLNPTLIETDESVRRWLDEQLKTIKPSNKPKGSD
jgi:hypothetical protein